MSEELEKKESNEPKKRGRPRKNPVVVEEKTNKKETEKQKEKVTKKEETTQIKRRGRPRKVSTEENDIKNEEIKGKEKEDSKVKENKDKESKEKENKKEQINKEDKTNKEKIEIRKKEEKKEQIEEEKNLTVKKNPKEIVISDEKLDKIEQEIKKQKTISTEKKNKINKMIFKNIMIAIGIIVFFIFVNLGYYNLEPLKYLKDLQVFSIITIGITIIIFERAYKKDSGELTIYGIESLIVSICTLMTIYIGMHYKDKFTYIINAIAMLFGVYYVAKSIVIYVKMKRKALKQTSDIHKIGRVK